MVVTVVTQNIVYSIFYFIFASLGENREYWIRLGKLINNRLIFQRDFRAGKANKWQSLGHGLGDALFC